MAQVYIINKASFVGYEDISVNIDPVRLNVFIKKAQDMDLNPFMGGAFFYDMIRQLTFNEDGTLKTEGEDATPQIYIDLLQGKEFTFQGKLFYFDGLIPALLYFTFARYIEDDSVHYTATGPVTKHRDDSDSLKLSEIMKLVQQQRSTANAKINEAIAFLNANKADYPLWLYNAKNTNARQPGPRMRGIDRTEVRRGQYNNNNGYLNGLL